MTITSGEYTSVYNTQDLGNTQDGWRVEVTSNRKGVNVDKFADTEIDGVYRGANCFLEAILKDWDGPGVNDVWWPYSATIGTLGVIARLEVASSLALATVLTALAGTPAATTGPATATFAKSILDAEFARTLNLNTEDRSIPIRLRVYPTTSTGVLFAFT
jgi:hypothetical protein